jgi:uncharacterized protein YqgC (DUF456 family)
MTDLLPITILAVSFLAGLVLAPLGLPGLWVMVLGTVAYGWMTDFRTIGVVTLAAVAGLAVVGEIAEAWLGFRYARRYGGSSRAGWGALLGGIVGAVIGVPVPLIGSVIGAFVGSFAGAAAFEYLGSWRAGTALGAGWGAVLGRAAAAAAKIALGVVIVVVVAFAIWRT